MCGRLLQYGVRIPYADHTFALQIENLKRGGARGRGRSDSRSPAGAIFVPDFRPGAPPEWPAMTSGWQHAAAWLFNPSPERALATCPSPWQISLRQRANRTGSKSQCKSDSHSWFVPVPAPAHLLSITSLAVATWRLLSNVQMAERENGASSSKVGFPGHRETAPFIDCSEHCPVRSRMKQGHGMIRPVTQYWRAWATIY